MHHLLKNDSHSYDPSAIEASIRKHISDDIEKDSLSKEGKIYLASIHKKKLTHTFSLCNVKVNSSEVYFMALKDYKMIHRIPLRDFRVQRSGFIPCDVQGKEEKMLHVFGLVFKFSETIIAVKFQEELADWLEIFRLIEMRNFANIAPNYLLTKKQVFSSELYDEYKLIQSLLEEDEKIPFEIEEYENIIKESEYYFSPEFEVEDYKKKKEKTKDIVTLKKQHIIDNSNKPEQRRKKMTLMPLSKTEEKKRKKMTLMPVKRVGTIMIQSNKKSISPIENPKEFIKTLSNEQIIDFYEDFLTSLDGEIEFPANQLLDYFEKEKKFHKEVGQYLGEVFFERRLIYGDSNEVQKFENLQNFIYVIQPEILPMAFEKQLKNSLLHIIVDDEIPEQLEKLNVIAFDKLIYVYDEKTKRLVFVFDEPEIQLFQNPEEFFIIEEDSFYKFICENEQQRDEWKNLYEK
eukprot:gene4376-7753_t